MIDGDENKTTVNIEMSRKMGAYDNWVEVSNANRQMTEVLEAISYGLNPNKEEVKSEFVHNGGNTDMEISNTFWAIAIFVVLFFFFLK
jgi:hypothetical protein